MIRLLIVEDSALMRKLLGRIFTDEGDFELAFARDGAEALAMIGNFDPDVVTLDIHMPQMDGLDCLDRIMLEHPCPVVMVSSLTDEGAEETLAALEMGAVDFIAKPSRAISLEIDELAPRLVEKVRMASTVRVRRSKRLAERVRQAQQVAKVVVTPAASTPHLRVAAVTPRGLVLIGASTGGPPALDKVLAPLTADFPWPVVVAQHMPASFTGPLSRRLNSICALEVSELIGQTVLEAGNIYIAKGDADVIISKRAGKLVAMPAPVDARWLWHPSVERMVTTAMQHVAPEALIGVLMTGMGTDGATAMTALKHAGGHTIAESEETAVVWGMPGELVHLGGATEVLPLDRISIRLSERLA
ncbi:MAG: chemotaxis-specific protein-glutamate methyltransferase CheB [Rhizobiaceae bacterium]|nr:chemotaxis-specific protein-glutamate methyltransferase CheB [Rhizobiaceae bacterium]